MRAILIDPEKKTLTEIQMQGGDYKETLRILRCSSTAPTSPKHPAILSSACGHLAGAAAVS